MKNANQLLFAIFLSMFIIACGSDTAQNGNAVKKSSQTNASGKLNPKQVSELFFEHFTKGDFEKAKKYCTGATNTLLDSFEKTGAKEKIISELKKSGSSTIKVQGCSVNEGTANCQLANPIKDGLSKVNLKNVNGNWQVHMVIGDFM